MLFIRTMETVGTQSDDFQVVEFLFRFYRNCNEKRQNICIFDATNIVKKLTILKGESKMKAKLFIIIGMLFASLSVFPNIANAKPPVRVLLVPIEYIEETAVDSKILEDVSRKTEESLKSFFQFVPNMDFIRTPKKYTAEELDAAAMSTRADFVIYISYSFTGEADLPKVVLNVKVWSMNTGGIILDKDFTADNAGDGLKATYNVMLKDLTKKIVGVDFKTATINLTDFEIEQPHLLDINDKIFTVSNVNFNLSIQVLAELTNKVELTRISDNHVVMLSDFCLSADAVTNIGYRETGTITIQPLADPDPSKNYQLFLDGSPIEMKNQIGDVGIIGKHILKLMDQNSNIIFKDVFSLRGGENRFVILKEATEKSLYLNILTTGGFYYPGVGFTYFFDRYDWIYASAALGLFLKAFDSTFPDNLGSLMLSAEYGRYLWNDKTQIFWAGAGVNAQFCFSFPETSWLNYSTNKNAASTLSIGVFGQFEIERFYFKLGLNFALGTGRFGIMPEIGVKF